MLPSDLSAAIEEKTAAVGTRELGRASAELTEWYRAGRPPGFRMGEAHRLAYAVARMPATFAVNATVLEELLERVPEARIESLLDLCAGPGTALWAAAALIGELHSATLLERDPGFIQLGRSLGSGSESQAVRNAVWQQAELGGSTSLPSADLVTLSYGLGELSPEAGGRLVRAAWEAARQALVLVEPGTPAGYRTILAARQELVGAGAGIAAPCPHPAGCPMEETERWCHFSRRLARTRLHRTTKGAELGFEDEKYSYLILTRLPAASFESRIVGVPRESKPAVQLDLCGGEGLQAVAVSRRDRAAFRQARRARWGGVWPPDQTSAEDIPPPEEDAEP